MTEKEATEKAEAMAREFADTYHFVRNNRDVLKAKLLSKLNLPALLMAKAERDELKKAMPDYEFITCAFCLHKVPKDKPQAIADHLVTCEKSPLVNSIKEAGQSIDMLNDGVACVELEREQLRAELATVKAGRDACAKERDTQCTLKQNCIAMLEKLRAENELLRKTVAANIYFNESLKTGRDELNAVSSIQLALSSLAVAGITL